ncbi:hypothetical protein LCGC14_1522760 [marine sediment metagenome]|uniref:Flp pilus-assembly TadG-like N-terminal domain-containing protein n=1 Tax=marine sediment metagenome TaxID=412755 RepID=A0A0F9LDQ3_9ZZZZ
MIGLKSGPKRVKRRDESGQTLILFVLALGVLLGSVAMSVDVGLILHERRSLQNAADAAALAGAIELPWIWHSDGNYMAVIEDIVSLGMNALNPLEPGCMDIPHIMRTYPHLTLVGNVDVDLLAAGTPDQVRAAVRDCFATMNPTGRYIAASGNSIPPFAKPENVRAMFDEITHCAGAT